MIRVFIADDHAVIREGIKHILVDAADMRVVGEASDAQGLLAQVAEATCDVVLLDSTLPGQNGLAILHALKHIQPQLPVLVFSTQVEHQDIIETFKAGAAGYLTKDCLPEELVRAIRQVVQGKRYVSPSLMEYLDWGNIAEN